MPTLDDVTYAMKRERAAEDERERSRKEIRAFGGGLIGGALGSMNMPRSGYHDQREYIQGLEDKQTLAAIDKPTTAAAEHVLANTGRQLGPRFSGNQRVRLKPLGVQSSYAGTDFAMRPSLSALRTSGRPNYGGGEDREDPNLRTFAPTFEQRRQGAILEDMDARAQRSLARDAEDNAEMGDLGSGRAGIRARMGGDIRRSERLQDARSGADAYFDPKVSQQREAMFANEMDRLRRRYSDPAMIRGQSQLEEARVRALGGLNRQDLINEGNINRQRMIGEQDQQEANTRARGQVGSAIAGMGGDPSSYVPPAGSSGRTMTAQDLRQFAMDQGLTEADARGIAEHFGWRIQ